MKKTIFTVLLVIMGLSLTAAPALAAATRSVANIQQDVNDTFGTIAITTGLPDSTLEQIVGGVINVITGFLGLIALIIILWGGFVWMTAGGNEEKVAQAKKLIITGIIGLAIILASYAIAKWVVDTLFTVVGVPEVAG